jgi:hypothetical protein
LETLLIIKSGKRYLHYSGTSNTMDTSREELDRLLQRARELGFTNVPNVRVLGRNSDGSEVIALDYPRGRRRPPGRILGTLVVKFYDDSEERHRDDPDFEDKSQHKAIVGVVHTNVEQKY